MENDSARLVPGDEPKTHTASEPELVYDMIALKAYFFALERHARGEPSDPFRDWLQAEAEIKSLRMQ